MEVTNTNKAKKKKFWKFFSLLGPGLTIGAADDDPSGKQPIHKQVPNLVMVSYGLLCLCSHL